MRSVLILVATMASFAVMPERSDAQIFRRTVTRQFRVIPNQVVPKQTTPAPVFAPPVVVQSPPVVVRSTPVYTQSSVVVPQACTGPTCNPTPSPVVPTSVTLASVSSDLTVSESSDSFRRTLVKAVQSAAKSGKINRRQAFRLRVALFSPAFQEACKDVCIAQIAFSGEASDAVPVSADGTIERDGIDWDGLADFLERIVPIILQLISLFGD